MNPFAWIRQIGEILAIARSSAASVSRLELAMGRIQEKLKQMSQAFDDLKAAVADLATDVSSIGGDVSTVATTLKDLRDKLAHGGTPDPADVQALTDAVAGIKQAHAGLQA